MNREKRLEMIRRRAATTTPAPTPTPTGDSSPAAPATGGDSLLAAVLLAFCEKQGAAINGDDLANASQKVAKAASEAAKATAELSEKQAIHKKLMGALLKEQVSRTDTEDTPTPRMVSAFKAVRPRASVPSCFGAIHSALQHLDLTKVKLETLKKALEELTPPN